MIQYAMLHRKLFPETVSNNVVLEQKETLGLLFNIALSMLELLYSNQARRLGHSSVLD